MTSTRRDFFKIVVGGITFSLTATNLKTNKIKTYAPATTDLGRELSKPLVKEGWHTVTIKDIIERESRIRNGDHYFDFQLETIDGNLLHSYVSPLAPQQLFNMMAQTKILPVHDGVDLNQFIGKEIKVKVEIETFRNKNLNKVTVK